MAFLSQKKNQQNIVEHIFDVHLDFRLYYFVAAFIYKTMKNLHKHDNSITIMLHRAN